MVLIKNLSIRTNLDTIVNIDRNNPIRVDKNSNTEEPKPYVILNDNIEAKNHSICLL